MSTSDSRVVTLLSAATPLVIGALGLWFTNIYKVQETRANQIATERLELDRQQRLLIDKANAVKQYFDYLANKSDQNQQQAALAVLASLGYTDLVIKVVRIDPSAYGVQALAAIAATGDQEASNSAVQALESIRETTPNVEASQAAEHALTNAQAAQSQGAESVAIVAGADRDLKAAEVEKERLKDAGYNAEIIKRGNWYRTVVPLKKSEASGAALEKIKADVRQSAYSVDISKWCDDAAGCIREQQP